MSHDVRSTPPHPTDRPATIELEPSLSLNLIIAVFIDDSRPEKGVKHAKNKNR
jgi:hypothetical protein